VVVPAPTSPVPPSTASRSLTEAAQHALTSLATYWALLFALAGAAALLLDGSVEMAPVKQPLMLAWVLAAAALLVARFLPMRARVPAVLGITVALAAGTVVGRELTGLAATWVQVTISGGMLLVAVGFVGGLRPLLPTAVLVVGLVLVPQRYDEMVREDSPVHLGVPLMDALLIVGLGLLAVLIRAVLLTSAAEADAAAREADEQRRRAVAEQVAADAVVTQMALLHDTALNTLDAIAWGSTADQAAQRHRCRQDAERLATSSTAGAPVPVGDIVDQARARAAAQGLALQVRATGDDQRVPADVAAALRGAIDEALLNVTKHAGTSSALLLVDGGDGGVRLEVTDAGRGFDSTTAASGFGLAGSVNRRMQAVGGDADVISRPGEGTRVCVRWARPAAAPPAEPPLSNVVRRLMVAFLVATMLFTSAVVLAEWQAFDRPWVTLGAGLLLGAWGLLVTDVLRRERWLPVPLALITIALACLAPFWTVPADPYCASTFTGVGWIDARIPLIVLVMLTSRFWWGWMVAAPAFLAATWLAGTLAAQVYRGCDSWVINALLFAVAIFVSSVLAGRTLRRQAATVAQAHRARVEAEDARVRAETTADAQRRWFAPAVAACTPLLSALGSGEADPADAAVQQRCRDESGYLRGLVTVARAPDGVRDEMSALLHRAHAHHTPIVVRGDLGQLPRPPHSIAPALRALPDDLDGATALQVTAVTAEGGGILMLHVPGGHLAPTPPPQPYGWSLQADDADGPWLEISWQADEAWPPEASSPPATPSRTPARSAASR
jgi:signal transduction histidine kinase